MKFDLIDETESQIILLVNGKLCRGIIHNTLMDYKEDLITKEDAIDRIYNSFIKYIEIKK